jgi:hypothetical protein
LIVSERRRRRRRRRRNFRIHNYSQLKLLNEEVQGH